jgi:hypothetical protein
MVQSEIGGSMTLVSHVKLIIPNYSTPERCKIQWAEVLGVDAERINEKAQAVIADEETFSERLASPSSAGFSPMIKSSFVSKRGKTSTQIKTNQRVNLARSYQKWTDKMDFQFAEIDEVPAARFKDSVNQAKVSMGEGLAVRTLPLTGIRVEGRGLVSLAGKWLTGDTLVESMLRAGDDIVMGGAYAICKAAKSFQLRTVLASQLVYVGAELIKNDFAAALMATLNQLTCEIVQAFVNPDLNIIPFQGGSPDSCVDYKIDPVLGRILDIRISTM